MNVGLAVRKRHPFQCGSCTLTGMNGCAYQAFGNDCGECRQEQTDVCRVWEKSDRAPGQEEGDSDEACTICMRLTF